MKDSRIVEASGPVAAIDCGTNSTRLLIVDGEGRPVAREMRITRLGQGVDGSGRLDDRALRRTLDVLSEYRRDLDRANVRAVRLVATSAVRDAENGEAFLTQASQVVGAKAEMLSGDEEGTLASLGATSELPEIPGDTVVIDIGGGSTELVVSRDGRMSVTSLPLGCVRVTERYLLHDPPTSAEVGEATHAIRVELANGVRELSPVFPLKPARRLVGLAGTVTTLVALDRGIAHYERDLIHHATLSLSAVRDWCDRMEIATSDERREWQGMAAGREDIILGGALVLREAMDQFGFDSCIVSEADILDGMVITLRNASVRPD